ncbi:RNA-directed DNA polymerase [Sphingobium yanoikuyae]|uniref:RNA-directed DNA polymerase n=1 Tax=Sphingobium yanoikuyae TaxID=13690 RepID=A0A6P1GM16_SPHYA|nr:reverse transcriptase family protein [Sphingobium yanoikuyae]QHD69617.1 RNA-directed DNA polymerase [Sphingobium yanoikuyae]
MAQRKKIPQIPAEQSHLYGIKSPHALANRLGWELDKLRDLAKSGGYRIYNHRKTGREIQEPGAALQSLHKQIHKYLARIQAPDYLHSAVKGKSYLSNAQAHVGDIPLIKIDIAKFYQSVPQHKVMHFFRDVMNCATDVAGLLANLICFRGALPTGSSVSPIISFYTYKFLFDDLADLAAGHGLTMTCYVDDITMSGPMASREVLHEARTMIFRAGLRAHKDRSFSPDGPKIVTGVAVSKHGIGLPFGRWQKIRNQIRELERCDDDNQKLAIYQQLISRLYEATQIDPRCRISAEYHHARFRELKRVLAQAASEPVPLKLAA